MRVCGYFSVFIDFMGKEIIKEKHLSLARSQTYTRAY